MSPKTILEKMRLDGKAALVTGGARGIGLAIATALLEAGARVALLDIDVAEAEKQAARLTAAGFEAMAIECDVCDEVAVAAAVERIVAVWGGLDIAFCNAGIALNEPAAEMSLASWKKVIDINLTGVFITARAAGRQMLAQGRGGSIVNTASMSAHIVNQPQPQCAYNASKAGVIQLTKSLAVEWAKDGIRVNCISPGYIGTELIRSSDFLVPLIAEWERQSPLGRLGEPTELQAIAVYLAGDASPFTTGSDFVIDGAFTAV
ncbi:MAG: SDR family oxidoreductase [Bacillota bacterium]|nr:SDR family oxidoreductase [Bacillota bacterium]